MIDLERLARVADEQLGVRGDASLVDAEDAELAAEGVVDHLEDVGQDMLARVRADLDGLHVGPFALHEGRRIALRGVRHEPHQDIEQLGDAGAGFCGDEADRDQVGLAQGLLEGVVELLRGQLLALLQVELHELFVHLDHLVDDLAVGLLDGGEVRTLAAGLEEAVDDPLAAVRRQVDGQALGAEGVLDLRGQVLQVHALGVDLVDDDHAAQVAVVCRLPHALGDGLDTGLGVDHDGGGLHRGQHRDAAADEVGESRGVDQVDVLAVGVEAGDADVQRVLVLLLHGIEIADGRASLHAAGLGYDSGGGEQGLYQGGLAGVGVADQGDVTDVLGVIVRHRVNLLRGLL